MNILLINHYAGSPRHGMEFRPYYLAREWCRMGHSVTIAAASQSHVRATQPVLSHDPQDEAIDAIDYRWYATPAYGGNGLGRVRNIAAFLWKVWRDTPALVRRRPDVVIASSTYPMDIWVARHIARRAGAKLVFEVHDLWPLSPIELGGMSPRHPFIRVCQWAEDTAYRNADEVVSMLPCVDRHMKDHGLDLRKLRIVPNGVSPEEWAGEPQPLREDVRVFIEAERAQGRVVVGYAGSHGVPNALDVLFDAIARLGGERISFVLVGGGMEKPRLQERLASSGLRHVGMFDPVPKGQIPALLGLIDVAYIGWLRTPIYRFGIAPNKLLDYMMAGCAVLHSVEAGNDPVAEAQAGITVAPEDPEAVADGLRRMAALPAAERRRMGENGRRFVQSRHTYPVLAERFLKAPTRGSPR